MSVLVDTSVWTDHFRGRPAARPLVELLETAQVVVHPFVLGELALGGVPRAVMRDLTVLPGLLPATHAATLALVRSAKLAGRGVGWVDAHLLAAARQAGVSLWTFDGALADAAADVTGVNLHRP